MNAVEASKIVEATLVEISRIHNIDLEQLREEHSPILEALQNAESEKVAGIEMRSWFISGLGFGRISKGDDPIDKTKIYNIIDAAIRLGNKSPRTLSIKKIDVVQSELASCKSIDEVVTILETNRRLICDSFGVEDSAFDQCVEELKELEAVAA
jgi:hypothetical protein